MEEQIREHENAVNAIELQKATIELKRSRNALLNISTLPPEILGKIFQSNVTLKGDFGGLEKGSHNFLFVCHHWLEVALHTPGVWSFWGNTLSDWARWCRYSATAPLDLVLGPSDEYDGPVDDALDNTLQDRAARDTIRRIHLRSEDAWLLNSILSLLTAASEGVRSNSVESLILLNDSMVNEVRDPVDVSDFFARYRFPKLQHLDLDRCRIVSWDLLTSRTTILTTLSLHFNNPSLTPTTSQLFSILTSNPTLQVLSLSGHAIPNDGGGESPLRVPLHRLKKLQLTGGMQHVLGLLHRLDHPANMDGLDITLSKCAVTDIPQTIGPYLRDQFRLRGRSRNGLALRVARSDHHTLLYAGDMCGTFLPAPERRVDWFLGITLFVGQTPNNLLEKGFLDLIAHTPRDDVVHIEPMSGFVAVEDISTQFPNIRALKFGTGAVPLSTIFPESKMGEDEIPPSLQHIEFHGYEDNGDWSPLTAFLARRASSGDRLSSLAIFNSHVCPEVEERIGSVVQVFYFHGSVGQCPFGTCNPGG